MKFPHFLTVACLELSCDFVNGVPVAERDDKLGDILMLAWAMGDNTWSAKS